MNEQGNNADGEVPIGDIFRPVVLYARLIWQGTLVLTAVAVVAGGLYLFLQPVTSSAMLGFRPLFEGAGKGKYPNLLPFSSTDIIDPSIVDQVIARNQLQNYCPAGPLRSALVVQETSPGLLFLDLEYQARLSDTRLTGVDRQRLQDEYTSRRAALPTQYQLQFVQPPECKRIPQTIVFKALGEILETWAIDSQEKRGVLKVRVGIITPGAFDQASAADEPLLVRADLIRSAMVRVINNITEVEKLPGAELIRVGPMHVSLAEVRPRIEDLMLARLDPLIGVAGKGLGRQSEQWVAQALESANAQYDAALKVAETYRHALREYSGVPSTPNPNGTANLSRERGSSSDVQSLTPQIDRTFIEGIVALSAANTTFRQEITRRVIEASNEAVGKGSVVEHYRTLLASMKATGGDTMSGEQVNTKLGKITAEAKEATRLFNDIYDEYSRVSFRAASAMYRIERPAEATTLRAFSLRSYVVLVLGVLLASPLALALLYLALHHLRRFVKGVA